MRHTKQLPKGWLLAGSRPADYDAGVEQHAYEDKAAVALKARRASNGFGTIMQRFSADAYRGQRLRLSAAVRPMDVAEWAGLWMRVDGEHRESLAFDNMQDRPITGTTDWTRYEVVLDVPDAGSTVIAFGVLLRGAGAIWMADVRLETVGSRRSRRPEWCRSQRHP